MSINPLTITFPNQDLDKREAAFVKPYSQEMLGQGTKIRIKADLMEEILGSGKSLAVHASIRLGLLEKLKEEPVSLENLSEDLCFSKNQVKRLFRALISLNLVRLESDRYRITEKGSQLLKFSAEKGEIYQGKCWMKLLNAKDAMAGNCSHIEEIARILRAQIPDEEKECFQMATQYLWARVLYFAAELKIADAIAEGTCSTKALSTRLQLDTAPLDFLLGLLEQKGLVYNREGNWQLTACGQELRISDPENIAHFLLVENHNRWMCLGMIDLAIRTGKVVFEEMFNKNMFEYFKENPLASAQFDLGMDAITALETAEIVESGVFEGAKQVIDIGGGRGLFLSSILERYPALQGVLFDLATVTAPDNIFPKLNEEAYKERLQIVGGSFFDSVPKSFGTYCMKRVLHDWNDENAVSILRQIHKSMQPGGELLIIEPLLDKDDSRIAPVLIDLMLMPLFEGKERTTEEMKALLDKAGFAAVETQKTGSFLTILKARKKD